MKGVCGGGGRPLWGSLAVSVLLQIRISSSVTPQPPTAICQNRLRSTDTKLELGAFMQSRPSHYCGPSDRLRPLLLT